LLRLHASYLIFAEDAELERCQAIHNLTVNDVLKYYTRNAAAYATVRQLALVFGR
jgi:hypothetical protein